MVKIQNILNPQKKERVNNNYADFSFTYKYYNTVNLRGRKEGEMV